MAVGSVWASVIALAVGVVLLLFLGLTTFGRGVRSIIQDETGARVVGIVASTPERTEHAVREVGAERAFRDGEELIASDDVRVVHVCTPNDLHHPLAAAALAAGKHVVCEKPLAVTEEECERILRACHEAGVRLMTAYRLHFDPLTLEVIDLVHKGRIGEPRYF